MHRLKMQIPNERKIIFYIDCQKDHKYNKF